MKFIDAARVFVTAAALLAGAGLAQAQGVIKLGLIAEFSGPFAQYGQQIYGGMKTYMKLHGDTVAGKKIEVIQKDTGARLRTSRNASPRSSLPATRWTSSSASGSRPTRWLSRRSRPRRRCR